MIEVGGEISNARLEAAVVELVGRHEVLRTRFAVLPHLSAPLQVVEPEPATVLEREDLDVRWRLVNAAGSRRLVVTAPALCADAATLRLIVRELRRLCAGAPLVGEPLQYADYATWQRDLVDGERGMQAARHRGGLPPPLPDPDTALPWERPAGEFRPDAVRIDAGAGAWTEIEASAAALGIGWQGLLLGAWQALAWHLTGADELTVALVADGRDADLAGAAGLYERRLPVTVRVAGGQGFATVAAAAEAAIGEALRWRDVPALDAGHPDAWLPLGFAGEDWTGEDAEPAGLTLHRLASCTDRYKLELRVRRLPEGWEAELAYDAGRFSATEASRLAERYVRVLEQIIRRPRAAIADLDLCAPEERRLAVRRGEAQTGPACLHELVEARAARTPDATAVVAGGERLTYGELDRRANRLAHVLRERGAGRGSRVGLRFERSPEAIIASLAVWKAGAATVPIDPGAPAAHVVPLLERAGVRLLAGDGEPVPGFTGNLLRLDATALGSGREAPLGRIAGPDDVAYVAHTSGSTGRPHGVLVAHGSAAGYLTFLLRIHRLADSDAVLQLTPFTFDAWLRDAIAPLTAGAVVVLAPNEGGASAVEAMRRHGVTRLLSVVPTVLRELVASNRGGPALGHLRTVLVSGEPLHLADCEAVWRSFGSQVAITNQYGPTECTMTTTFGLVTDAQRGRDAALLGEPVANAHVCLLGEGLQPVPPGLSGEICIGGAGLAHGYLGEPGLTAARFVPDPLGEPGGRLYRTGDLGRQTADGGLEFLGRRDHQVKVHGVRVEPAEIEATLAGHPGVREVAVVPHAGEGQAGLHLIAFVAPAPGAELSAAALLAFAGERLPAALAPASFVLLESLPRTAHGKVDRRRLHEESAARPARAGFVPPRSALEARIAAVFAETLEVERVGAEDGFFELGGHSLMAARAVYQINESLGVELPLRAIFEHPTPARLAAFVGTAAPAAEEVRIPRLEREPPGGWPLSPAQQRIWLLDQLDPGNPSYNLKLAVRFSGELRVDLLGRSLDEVVRRQEALRSTIVPVGEEAALVVHEPEPVHLPVVDLTPAPAAELEAEVRRRILAQAALPFDLARRPLLKASLLRLGDTEHVLVLTMHHAVMDEWSAGILVGELTELYEAFREGRPHRLPRLEIRNVDFADWQRRWLAGERLERLLDHWIGVMRGARFELKLPFDRPRPETPSPEGGRLTRPLPRPLTTSLAELGRREGATTFMTLLGAFLVLLREVTGQDDLVVSSPIANRTRSEVEPLIGFFANILLLRVGLAGDPTFRELLARVREVTIDAYAHQELPFEQLVAALRPARAGRRTPLVHVWFVLHNAPMPDLRLPGLRLSLLPMESETAKFDLNFALTGTDDDLSLAVEYSSDVFEAATARRLMDRYQALLAHVATHPEDRLSDIRARGARPEREEEGEMTAEEGARPRASRPSALRAARPSTVRMSADTLVRSGNLRQDEPLPLLVEPAGGQLDLASWIGAERNWVSERLLVHGGILFRGFGVDGAEAFERVVHAYSPDLLDYYERSTPRQQVGGKVYTSTEYPPERHIPLHCESAYSHYWPLKLWFHCAVPAGEGGATPVCDSRKVLELMDPTVRRRFEESRVMYVRNYHEGFDIPWQVAFQTEDRDVVAEYCRRAGMEFEWREQGVLRTRHVLDAVVRHPVTGQPVWFNQAHAFHISTLDPDVQQGMRELFADEDLPRDVRYGDGSPIGAAEFEAIRAAIAGATISFPWQRGDVLLLDNMLVAHGREPYRGSRRVLVGMSEPWDRHKLAASQRS